MVKKGRREELRVEGGELRRQHHFLWINYELYLYHGPWLGANRIYYKIEPPRAPSPSIIHNIQCLPIRYFFCKLIKRNFFDSFFRFPFADPQALVPQFGSHEPLKKNICNIVKNLYIYIKEPKGLFRPKITV